MALCKLVLTCLALACVAWADESSAWIRNCEEDTRTPVEGELEGSIPDWVEGRLIRVGGGIRHVGNTTYRHMFDPLAILHMVQIQDGQATYTSRFLESDTYKNNMREQRIAESEFGTPAFPDPCQTIFQRFSSIFQLPVMGDNCLVNVLQATDQLIAMTETDVVRVVDPSNLKVIGDGIKLPNYIPVQRASAHPHVGRDGTIYNLAPAITNKGPGYSITSHKNGHVKEASVEATILARWKFNPAYMHSFGITENFYILIESPLAMNTRQMLTSSAFGTTPEEALIWYPNEQSRFRVIKRSDGQELDVVYMADKFFTFHHINAYEVNDVLVVDVAAIESGEVIKSLYIENVAKKDSDPTKMKFDSVAARYVMPVGNIENYPYHEDVLQDIEEIKIVPEDSSLPVRSPSAVRTGTNEFKLQGATINDMFFELPRINYVKNGIQYRYAYAVGTQGKSLEFSSIIKLDIKTGKELVWSDPDYYVSEPVFLPKPGEEGEDSGVVLTTLLHKKEVNHLVLLILDARDMSQMAKVYFTAQGVVTPTFHGQFVSVHDDIHGY